jgi:hypothetical protein
MDRTVHLQQVTTNHLRRITKQDQLPSDTSAVLATGGTLPSGFARRVNTIPCKDQSHGLADLLGLAAGVPAFKAPCAAATDVITASLYTADRQGDNHQHLDRQQHGRHPAGQLDPSLGACPDGSSAPARGFPQSRNTG